MMTGGEGGGGGATKSKNVGAGTVGELVVGLTIGAGVGAAVVKVGPVVWAAVVNEVVGHEKLVAANPAMIA